MDSGSARATLSSSMQPKINQRLLLRSAISLLILAGLFMAFRWYRARETDLHGTDTLATVGWIAAIQETDQGNRVVAIKPDGTLVQQGDPPADAEDRDVVWRPDGNFIFFASDRDKGRFAMYRWYPQNGSTPEKRSIGARSQSAPFFLRGDGPLGPDAHALVTAGGVVMEYDPKTPALHQTLPPPDKLNSDQSEDQSGEGRKSAFEGEYEHFGTSFKYAKWTPDKSGVFAVMRRETGEILIYQKLNAPSPEEGAPRPIVAGDRVDFDIDQKTGVCCFIVQNFQWPDPERAPEQFRKGRTVTVPFHHGIGLIDLSKPQGMEIIAASNNDKFCFAEPALTPAGDFVAFVGGAYQGNGNMTPAGLYVVPAQVGVKDLGQTVATGDVHEPSWSPDGTTLAFAQRIAPNKRPIFTISRSDPVVRQRSPDGVFESPKFSPQG